MFRSIKSTFKVIHAILFRQNKFRCKVSVNKNYEFVVWERPGEWCTEEQIQEIRTDLRRIATLGQGDKDVPEYGVLSEDEVDFSQRIITIVYCKKTGEPIGFSAKIYFDIWLGYTSTRVMHTGLMYVVPEHRGQSITHITYIFPMIILLLKSGLRPIWVSSVSQVPSVIGVVAEGFIGVYPHPIKKRKQRFKYKMLGIKIMKYHRKAFGVGEDAEYDPETQIIKNAYTGGSDNLKKSYEDAMKHRKEKVNLTCKEELDYDRGDDYLQLGILNVEVIWNFLKNSSSKRTFAKLGFNLSIFLFSSLFIPLIRWLVPPKDKDLKFNGEL